jgi:hypothetical protein
MTAFASDNMRGRGGGVLMMPNQQRNEIGWLDDDDDDVREGYLAPQNCRAVVGVLQQVRPVKPRGNAMGVSR